MVVQVEIIICMGYKKWNMLKYPKIYLYYHPKKNIGTLSCVQTSARRLSICLSACQETDSVIFLSIVICIVLSIFSK